MVKKIVTLVQRAGHCVLATCGGEGAAPHASLMSFCAADDCREFWMATLAGTRKHRNLVANPNASLLLDDRGLEGAAAGPRLALTVAARLAPFPSPEHEAQALRALAARHTGLRDFLALEGVVALRLQAVSFQLLSGLTDVFFVEVEKMLDAETRRA